MNLQDLQAQLNQRMEECGEDFREYNKRFKTLLFM